MKLTALKPLRYGTRRLQPGEAFDANNRDAKLLIAVKRARAYDDRQLGKLPAPQVGLVERFAGDDMTALRREYFEKMGKRPFHGWGAATLREKIAEHRGAGGGGCGDIEPVTVTGSVFGEPTE